VVDRLAETVDQVLVVSAPGQSLPSTPAQRVEDHEEGLGPLAGLCAGLAASGPGIAFVTAADAPFLTPDFVRAVLAPGHAAAPVAEGRVQTLSAAYPTEAGEVARSLLDQGRRRPLDLLEHCDFERLALSSLPDPESVRGFNTPGEYLAAARADRPGGLAWVALGDSAGDSGAAVFGGEPREVEIGTLGEILMAAGADARVLEGDSLSPPYVVCLNGRARVRDARIPIGAGEKITVLNESSPSGA
jgi:molybdopterin-guanine dinucleotide biosynthesis protein A